MPTPTHYNTQHFLVSKGQIKGKVVLVHAIKSYLDRVKFSSTHSYPFYWMKLGGQVQAPAALTVGKLPMMPIVGLRTGVDILEERKSLSLPEIESLFLHILIHRLVTTHTDLHSFRLVM